MVRLNETHRNIKRPCSDVEQGEHGIIESPSHVSAEHPFEVYQPVEDVNTRPRMFFFVRCPVNCVSPSKKHSERGFLSSLRNRIFRPKNPWLQLQKRQSQKNWSKIKAAFLWQVGTNNNFPPFLIDLCRCTSLAFHRSISDVEYSYSVSKSSEECPCIGEMNYRSLAKPSGVCGF